MKFINVTGINLQFDSIENKPAKEQAETMVMLINERLSELFSHTQPQITLSETSEEKEMKIEAAIRAAYYWGRDNGLGRSEKNINDFFQTTTAKQALNVTSEITVIEPV